MTSKTCLKLLKIAIIGTPNAGKSTLLNRLVCSEISCVSNKVHTTRKNMFGVYTYKDTQLEFYDSPGLIKKMHLHRHKLEDTLLTDPQIATKKCDLIAVVVDANNIRENKRLNKGIVDLLNNHIDKESILIMNKVDLVKDKRKLLDIGTRLTEGCLNGKLTISEKDIRRMPLQTIIDLNLKNHAPQHLQKSLFQLENKNVPSEYRPKHKFVIELDPIKASTTSEHNDGKELISNTGFNGFSRVFSISALNDEGVGEVRKYMLSLAKPIEDWPHGPDYLTNQNTQDIVHQIVRGKLMDNLSDVVPYVIKFKYNSCNFDELGSLNVQLDILCPEEYMVSKVIGKHGLIISKVIEDSRDLISKTLGCDVKLVIGVESSSKSKRKERSQV